MTCEEAYTVLKKLIEEHNKYEWEMAKLNHHQPDLLPALVAVKEVLEEEDDYKLGGVSQLKLRVLARYRIYYSRRESGSRTALRRFHLGRIREGVVRLRYCQGDLDEGFEYDIEFEGTRKVFHS